MNPRISDSIKDEKGTIIKPKSCKIKVALAYPNTYSVALSNLGFQTVYRNLNMLPSVVCERVVLPLLPTYDKKLISLETGSKIRSFNILGISIYYELDYINVLKLLELSGIPLRAVERSNYDPLVIAGGPAVSFNPEPLSDFLDAVIIGESEEVLPKVAELLEELQCNRSLPREETLKELAQIEGVYVPIFYKPIYEAGKFLCHEIKDGLPNLIRRQWVRNLNDYPTYSQIVTPHTEFSSMYLVELSRGCGRGCRFCIADFLYRMPRFRRPDIIIKAMEHGLNFTNKFGLLGTSVSDYPELEAFIPFVRRHKLQLSVSSVRLDSFNITLAQLLSIGGQKTITFAPEAATEDLRNLINKPISNQELFDKIELAKSFGIDRFKLYFLIGLPKETDSDVEAIVELCGKLIKIVKQLSVNIGIFVPKPQTPFQWQPLCSPEILQRRIKLLKDGFKKIRIKFNFESPKWAAIQAILSKGDRHSCGSELLLKAYRYGGNLGAWQTAIKETNSALSIYESLDYQQPLPWQIIDTGINKDYLWREYQQAELAQVSPACPTISSTSCRLCGICS